MLRKTTAPHHRWLYSQLQFKLIHFAPVTSLLNVNGPNTNQMLLNWSQAAMYTGWRSAGHRMLQTAVGVIQITLKYAAPWFLFGNWGEFTPMIFHPKPKYGRARSPFYIVRQVFILGRVNDNARQFNGFTQNSIQKGGHSLLFGSL